MYRFQKSLTSSITIIASSTTSVRSSQAFQVVPHQSQLASATCRIKKSPTSPITFTASFKLFLTNHNLPVIIQFRKTVFLTKTIMFNFNHFTPKIKTKTFVATRASHGPAVTAMANTNSCYAREPERFNVGPTMSALVVR